MKNPAGRAGCELEGRPSRWSWMGPASLWVTLASLSCSAVALALMWASLSGPDSIAPVWWSLGGVCLCAIGNLTGQTLALFGIFGGDRSRRQSLWALAWGIAGLVGLLAGVFIIFWRRGLLGM